MRRFHHRIGILGAGFGGTLTGLILQHLGWDPVVMDRQTHPRFAVGESSTPIADCILEDLCRRYGLAEILPLCRYGTATSQREQFLVGPKRGFSYFFHEPHQPFTPNESHDNELLVAASGSLDSADTHWHRATVDHWLTRRAGERNVPVLQGLEVSALRQVPDGGWRLTGVMQDEAVEVSFDFLIDASGRGSPLATTLQLEELGHQLATHSGAIFGHFDSVEPVQRWYRDAGGDLSRHPFPCDQAAVHQVTATGWMWQLRFDHDVTSVGWCLPAAYLPAARDGLDEWWHNRTAAYPTLARQFGQARLVDPPPGLQQVGRLQYLRSQGAGNGWAMLPASFGFVDPLHSSGIAHTLAVIERLTRLFESTPESLPTTSDLADYSEQLRLETLWLDQLVSCCYRAMPNFQLFRLVSMWYFLAAIHYETRRSRRLDQPGLFLSADEATLRAVFTEQVARLPDPYRERLTPERIGQLGSEYRGVMKPFNVAGLLDPTCDPFYRHTAAPGK